MSARPVKEVSIGILSAIAAIVSLMTVPTLNRLSSANGVSNSSARPGNERITGSNEVSSNTAKHSAIALLPAVKNRNTAASAPSQRYPTASRRRGPDRCRERSASS